MTQKSTSPQANISEFNTITGLVFTPVDLNRAAIESAMGAAFSSGSTNILQSGRPFTEVFAHSLAWLSNKGYVRSAGPLPYEKVTLTTKGLAALNAVPQELSTTIGSTLATNASAGNWSSVGDLIGDLFGGYTKSITAG